MKICSTCQHYYVKRQLCEAPLPLWLDNYDPIGNIASDEHTTMPPETDATTCRTYRKRRKPNIPKYVKPPVATGECINSQSGSPLGKEA